MADLFASLSAGTRPARGRHGAAVTPPGVAVRILDRAVATVIARPGRTPATIAALGRAFATAPADASRLTEAVGVAFVGIAPGRWTALAARDPDDLVAALEAAIGDDGFVVDQSGGQVVLALDGPRLPDLVAALVAVDLDASAAPADRAVTTTLAHVGATLLPGETAGGRRLVVGRSMLPAALRAIVSTAAEFGCDLID